EGVVDFAELLLRSFELLQRNAPLREHYQARFKHILVDEFQDTNDLQYNLLKLLAGHGERVGGALFAVGDDDQSIYAFRGANVGNMSAFEREFKIENLIKLEQNYRSHGHILDSANQLIANNPKRLGKNLRTDAGLGEQVRIYEATSDLEEARWLVEETKSLFADGVKRSEIAILYRSNAQSRVIEHALFAAGLPYTVYGGQRYFQRAEVKHAIAYLQLMDNPHNDSAFLRVVNFPTRGIGMRSIEALQAAAGQHQVSLYAAVPYVGGKAGASLGGFVKLVEGVRFDTMQLSLPEMVRLVLEASTLLTHYGNEKEGADRIENLEQMVNAATQFVQEEGFGYGAPATMGPRADAQAGAAIINQDGVEILDADAPMPSVMSPLSAFLSHASLEAGDAQAQAGQDALQLMTVHSAKGLEFNAVFITGLEEGLFPHESSARELDGVDEERRLMYVAITRARQRLYMSFTQQRMLHGQTRYNMKSRFFDELPEASLKWMSPKVQSHWAGNKKSAWDDAAFTSAGSDNKIAQQIVKKAVGTGWRIGESVAHAKFGEGVIVNLEGGGDNARAQINFGRAGMKVLDLSVAKLERVGR
ncbi:MAG: UvrD-helicase domain-containing protein, partial [Massilia sp.]|nr:UvrD-helicase domain-containing protein [Massilia sp.]